MNVTVLTPRWLRCYKMDLIRGPVGIFIFFARWVLYIYTYSFSLSVHIWLSLCAAAFSLIYRSLFLSADFAFLFQHCYDCLVFRFFQIFGHVWWLLFAAPSGHCKSVYISQPLPQSPLAVGMVFKFEIDFLCIWEVLPVSQCFAKMKCTEISAIWLGHSAKYK